MQGYVEVETHQGRLRGETGPAGVQRFLGIPFAAPPTGDRRFLAPAPATPWRGVRDALAFGPAVPQRAAAGELGEMIGIASGRTDEDCLYLNVWTPGADSACRPVLVWVHGGANQVGSGSQPRMNGQTLAARGDVVVVTFNYRLGALGFLHAPEIGASGNQALLDQIAALEWVRREIAAFGGDPANVTVFGQSAGGFDIAQLLAIPRAQGRFDKAILMSGSLRPQISRESAARTTAYFAEAFGGVGWLREVTAEALVDRQARVSRDPLGGEHRFGPTRDGEVVAADAAEVLATGRYDRGIPILLGTAHHEWNLFSAFDPRSATLDEGGLRKRIARRLPGLVDETLETYREGQSARGEPFDVLALWNAFMTDESFRIPAIQVAELHSAHTPATFVYRFDRESPAFGGRLRACHSIDVPFVFGTHRLASLRTLLGADPALDRLSERMIDAFVAFARTGAPSTPDLPAWLPYAAGSRAVMALRDEPELLDDPDPLERLLWERAREVPRL